MLTIYDLIDIDYIPKEAEISLELLVDFYEQYLSQRIFKIILDDEKATEIKISFNNASEIYHLSGINHIYGTNPMDGTRFVAGIRENTIDFFTLKKINKPVYNDYLNRICGIACLDTIIKKCEYLYFSSGKIPGSSVRIQYLLIKGLDNKSLHLGIDSYNSGKNFYAKTLLVTEGGAQNKYVERADAKWKIASLSIIDKASDQQLDFIDRKNARLKAKEMIEEIGNAFIEDNMISNRFLRQKIKNEIELKKELIREEIKKYDPYCVKKIVAEEINNYINKLK